MKKIGFILLILVATNAFLYIQLVRTNEKVAYHATHICELERLSSLRMQLPIGSSSEKLNALCELSYMECGPGYESTAIDYSNVVRCPVSGRPYCGFRVTENNNKIQSVTVGYPCH